MRVAYLTWHDPRDVRHWSGTHSFMFGALASRVEEVVAIGPFQTPSFYRIVELLLNAWHRGPGARSRGKYRLGFSLFAALAYSLPARRRLRRSRCDVIFAPTAAREVIFSAGETPFVYLNDAIFPQVAALYPRFQDYAALTYREAEYLERSCMRRAAASVFSSQWAADAAALQYGGREKIKVIPFGANLEHPPSGFISRDISGRSFRLLVVGKEWLRKGVDLAVESVRLARTRGADDSGRSSRRVRRRDTGRRGTRNQ